jgi:hypothetical protein
MNKNLLSQTPKSPMVKMARLMELQAIVKKLKPEIDELKADLLKVTQDLDVYTLKTGNYTLSRAKRITPQVVDFKLLKETLDKEDIPYETEEVFTAQTNVMFKQAIADKRELAGLEALETEYISIRLSDKVKEVNKE